MTDDIPSLIERLRAWKSLRACDFEENSPLAEDLEAAAQALQQHARDRAQLVEIAAIEMGKRDARICELEAERDAAKGGRHILAHGVNELTIEIGQLRAERDKLRETLEIPAPSPPCMMPDGGECCPQYHAAVIRIDKLRETLAGMDCPRYLNGGTIAYCTECNQCSCNAGAVFVKTGVAQK